MEFAIVGNPTIDLVNDEERIGGAVIYTSLTIANLGYPVTVIGNHGTDFNFSDERIDSRLKERGRTARFSFNSGFEIIEKGEAISVKDVKGIEGKIIHCAPIFNEISPSLLRYLRRITPFLSADAQGFLRREKMKKVYLADYSLPVKLDFLKASEEESLFIEAESDILSITLGDRGAKIIAGEVYKIPAFKTKAVDCIGAGDVFCGAFLVRYMETKDVYQSGLFASAAASISCEGRGIHSIPQRNEVIDRIRKYEMNY